LVDDVLDANPKFLKIPNVEIKKLPDLAKLISRFNKIKKSEWVPKTKDKRFTSKRKTYEYHNA